MSTLSMKQLLESGAQFGHQVNKLNRQMRPFIFSESNNIHIIDLKQTIQEMNKACVLVREITSSDGTILFVGRKEKAREIIKAEAVRCEMPYVNEQRNNEDLSDNITLLNEINGLFEHHKNKKKVFYQMPLRHQIVIPYMKTQVA